MRKAEGKTVYDDPVERENPVLVYSEIDPDNPGIWADRQGATTIIKTYILVSASRLHFIKKLIDAGYTDSVDRFVRDALNEKIERTMKDYETLGKLLSDRLQSESGDDVNCKWDSYDEHIDFHIAGKRGLQNFLGETLRKGLK